MSDEFTTLSSKSIFKNRWMAVREDEFIRSSGTTGTFYVLEKVDFAVIIAAEDGQLHLVEQYRYALGGRYWEFPQGSWDQALDPLLLAKAELREETGLIADSMRHAGRLFLAPGYSQQAYDVFFATGLSCGETQLDPEEEGLITRAFALHDVEKMILAGEIQDATTVAAFGLLRLKGWL